MCVEDVYFNTFTLKSRKQSWFYHNLFCYMFTMNNSRGFMIKFMLQDIHSVCMLAWRSARRTVIMTWQKYPVHEGTTEPGGTVIVMIPT